MQYRPSSAYNAPFYTTNGGAPVSNNISSLTIGERGIFVRREIVQISDLVYWSVIGFLKFCYFLFWAGPVLLEDYHLIEKVANFTRERIPERVVHARGISAKGFFEVTHDISNLTCADFLRAPGVQTPVIVRFSTVVHERASPETMRDIRGFAVKFYTREV